MCSPSHTPQINNVLSHSNRPVGPSTALLFDFSHRVSTTAPKPALVPAVRRMPMGSPNPSCVLLKISDLYHEMVFLVLKR